MKCISLWQPWATAIFIRRPEGGFLKTIETRSWMTNYTGRIAIHAAKTFPKEALEFAQTERALGRLPSRLPLGSIIGTVTLKGMVKTEDIRHLISEIERLYGNYSDHRWAWMLYDPIAFHKPIPYPGKQRLFEVPDELIKKYT